MSLSIINVSLYMATVSLFAWALSLSWSSSNWASWVTCYITNTSSASSNLPPTTPRLISISCNPIHSPSTTTTPIASLGVSVGVVAPDVGATGGGSYSTSSITTCSRYGTHHVHTLQSFLHHPHMEYKYPHLVHHLEEHSVSSRGLPMPPPISIVGALRRHPIASHVVKWPAQICTY